MKLEIEVRVDESDFEGTLILEKMAELGKLDQFWEAIDSDDLSSLKSLMRRANIDSEIIHKVIALVQEAD